jgi:predicted O-linked N-acetylglucosamine transferase (SPINDLY family)
MQPSLDELISAGYRHFQNGQLREAERCFQDILETSPGHVGALTLLGVTYTRMGRSGQAAEMLGRAAELQPDSPMARYNLGVALQAARSLEEAIAAFSAATALKPDYAPAYLRLGEIFRDQGKLPQAVDAFSKAVQRQPDLAGAHYFLGLSLYEQGRFPEAIRSYLNAIEKKPDLADAYNGLGIVYNQSGKLDEGLAALRKAIALRPDYAEAHNNLANALNGQGLGEEAIAAYRRAVALDPGSSLAHGNLAYTLYFSPAFDGPAIREEHGRWDRQHALPLRRNLPPHANDPNPNRRLRVGYVSPNFATHPVGLGILQLLEHHDRTGFEVFCYSGSRTHDALTPAFQAAAGAGADAWRETSGWSDEQLADCIRRDRIDILVDLSMHMAANRLLAFARKPAPVQVTYLAYPGTTGLETMDYRLTDPYLDPPGSHEGHYAERSIRLPDSWYCYNPQLANPPEVGPLPALAAGRITFACLNNFNKVNASVLTAWSRLLRAVPQSRLFLIADEGELCRRTRERMEREGVDGARVQFLQGMPRLEYFQLYNTIDISLDPFPYNGGTTSCDSLWMGVPVISLAGRTAAGRQGLALLSNLGLPELAAPTVEDYIRIAAALAGDLPRLTRLRAGLRERMRRSPLCDSTRFARNVEAAFREMWKRWCAGRTAG